MLATLRLIADNYWKFIVNDYTSSNNPLVNAQWNERLSKYVIKPAQVQELSRNSFMAAGFPSF